MVVQGFKEFNGGLDGFYQVITSYMAPGDPVANMYVAFSSNLHIADNISQPGTVHSTAVNPLCRVSSSSAT